jgi:hypothetical protein
MIELLITGGALLGAIIGRFFKVLVLIPVCAVAAALQWMNCQMAEKTVLDSLASVGLLIQSRVWLFHCAAFNRHFRRGA